MKHWKANSNQYRQRIIVFLTKILSNRPNFGPVNAREKAFSKLPDKRLVEHQINSGIEDYEEK